MNFNPRTREGCDIKPLESQTLYGDFNPRTREGCDGMPYQSPQRRYYFNPRTREGCDVWDTLCNATPADISIHAPVKGATLPLADLRRPPRDFNPRTREGCDDGKRDGAPVFQRFQSTHP